MGEGVWYAHAVFVQLHAQRVFIVSKVVVLVGNLISLFICCLPLVCMTLSA